MGFHFFPFAFRIRYSYVCSPSCSTGLLLTMERHTVIYTIPSLYLRLWWLLSNEVFYGLLELAGWSCQFNKP
ncbi:hypothetical protein BGW80DRAFT_832384 [Lactifluus volemus]|nr:hypothetical protein BGW80DRAFT_832384 [Lactifluus volemus]